jgi:cytochrome b561
LQRNYQNNRYSRVAMLLHWLIAVLIVANVVLALSADSLSDTTARTVIDLHKSFGITVLGLAIMRILWRMAVRPPPIPSFYPGWEKKLAHLVHWLLYLLMFALPLSGWMHDSAWKDAATHPMHLYGLIEWPRIAAIEHLDPVTREGLHTTFGSWHTWFGYCLYVLVALHLLGALKHQILDRQPEFQRMWPWGRSRDNSTRLFR